ncbi:MULTISPECIES: YbaB/EbfC family nucleoid-associated protein [Eubacteriales]|uniref:Nucleoid-associated protein GT747_01950 n=1 Tax=Bittarella massiliensis (ex Durand et al. 2017) TaxID=1720313 RepID=A0AAQ1MAX4_9FIRM|nr:MULTISPECIES: YbaB/EbfC family nucleoid-associated protein [Eubacteriales]MBC2871672.1 YbaB/EbfC family nucleoid-associated protein [Bittarella massiliensis (ex Durand et al. 2017)]MBO1678618.1 YbaB/EbfC family nucleoid-associated protein [Bittarella massiliensis (ex Durand et al. 2017)]MCQ4949281.1 YbaB/EbfC family nucleoid-associated protein [Bittarella massiliensis (ex Durand et al. 2017)]MZL68539.1 YbaB/EbfC family nucleoid-associated protein [Bittarella massiliensis (ex Durand et al. 20
MKARLPQGYGPKNMNQMIKQAQEMQERIAQVQDEIEESEFKVSAGGGMIEVTINGKKELTALEIKPEVVDPDDIEMLQDLIMAAVNEAVRKVEDEASSRMAEVTGGAAGLPGMPF